MRKNKVFLSICSTATPDYSASDVLDDYSFARVGYLFWLYFIFWLCLCWHSGSLNREEWKNIGNEYARPCDKYHSR